MSKVALGIGCLLLLGGCAGQVADFAREPHLTPVGAGLRPDRVAMLSEPPPVRSYQRGTSFWQERLAPTQSTAVTGPSTAPSSSVR